MLRWSPHVVVTAGGLSRSRVRGGVQRRSITSRGQFNPIHDFSFSVQANARPVSEAAFRTLITNPGPLRVGFSQDYVAWLYLAYKSKLSFAAARAKAERVFNGALLSQASTSQTEEAARLPGAPPPGHFLRPRHSYRRIAGEAKRAHAQEVLDSTAREQGMLDLLERQPQFPVIHLQHATRYHLVELLKEVVLDRALSATEVWDKALLYRAIMQERRAAYPASFRYILDTADQVELAPWPEAAAQPSPSSTASPASDAAQRSPSEEDYAYFVFLVKRYFIDNAVEGHVVLRCHREANSAALLFSNPPPRDEEEVRRAIFGVAGSSKNAAPTAAPPLDRRQTLRAPTNYPPIDALWRCAENLPLVTVLVFGELNLLVSEDPFAKFPNAQAHLTRPYASASAFQATGGGGATSAGAAGRRDMDGVSLANLIAQRRGHLLAPLSRNVASALDARGHDLRRLQQRYHREDIAGFQKLLRGAQADANPANFSAFSDWSYFNPRAVRAEERDRLQRRGIDALKLYDRASQDIFRAGFERVEAANSRRSVEQSNTAPPYIPTLAHFVSIVRADPHTSFLLHVGLPERAAAHGLAAELDTGSESNSSEVNSDDAMTPAKTAVAAPRNHLEQLVYRLAHALYQVALHYHQEQIRRVNHQKVLVAAATLDEYVTTSWHQMLERYGVSSEDELAAMARRLGAYRPFAARVLDETGFPTDARMDDYNRWMAPPAAA